MHHETQRARRVISASLQMRRIKKQMLGNISARLCSAFSAFQCKQRDDVSSSIRLPPISAMHQDFGVWQLSSIIPANVLLCLQL
ncbi:hypothetical protein M9458_057076, partial [Cirrhinus mrigala]